MTRHSTLTNPNDLHYAKVRTFAGDPNLVSPDFADQLLIASDTKKIYTSTSTDQGAIVQLVASMGENLAASIELGSAPPIGRPTASGRLYLDVSSNSFYASVLNPLGVYWWRRIVDLHFFFNATFSLTQGTVSPSDLAFCWFYAPNSRAEIEAAPFDFNQQIDYLFPLPSSSKDFSNLIYSYGPGAYAIGYTQNNPTAFEGKNITTEILATDGGYYNEMQVAISPYSLSANGLAISSTYLYISDLPPNTFNEDSEQITFDCQLIAI